MIFCSDIPNFARRQFTVVTYFVLSIAVLVVASSNTAQAQTKLAMPMHFSHLTLDDGLSQNNIQAIFQDSRGYMWFATESGLNRYDGYDIRRYSRERGNPQGLGNDFIWTIAEDADSNLWLATQGGGIVRWNRSTDTFDSIRHDPANPSSLASNDIRTLLLNSDGTIWVGTRDKGLDLLDPRTGDARHFRQDPNDPRSISNDAVYALLVDISGQLLVGTDAGLNGFVADSAKFVRYQHDPQNPHSLSDNKVRAIYQDHIGVLWVGTSAGGLNKFNNETGEFIHFQHNPSNTASLSDNHVRVIVEDDTRRLWVGTADGLNHLDRVVGTFNRYRNVSSDPQSLNDSYINSLYQDRGGVLWIGTRSAGVSKWNPRSWSLGHYVQPEPSDADVTSFATDNEGNLWVGTLGGGITRIDGAANTTDRFLHEPGNDTTISDDRVMSLLVDRNGILWIGTMSAGVDRMDPATGNIRSFRHDVTDPNSLGADGVMTLFEDRDGKLWIGTYGGGVSVFNPESETFRRYDHDPNDPNSISNPRASAILQDDEGAIWIGTFGGGLNRLKNDAKTFERFQHNSLDPNSLSDNTVYDLHLDGNGQIWVGTAGGGLDYLVRSSTQSNEFIFKNVSQQDGLPSNVIYGVRSDAANRLWLSTNYGLARFDPGDSSVKTFHRSHGLQGEEFNFGAHHRGVDGKLYFGGANGFNAFDPGELEEGAHEPEVVLTSYQKLNKPAETDIPYDLLEQIELGYRDDVVTFEFAALDFTAPLQNKYSYSLEGFDNGWIDAGVLRRVTYTNLDAGQYVFRVKAATSDGIWSEPGLSIPVTVAPAPWQTVWAYSLYGVTLLILMGIVSRSHRRKRLQEAEYSRRLEHDVAQRTEQLEERNEELRVASRAKSDFLARMSHEIRTPMNGMLGMTQLLMRTVLDDKQHRFAQTIKRSAETLLEIINDILDFSKIEAGRLELDSVEFDVSELVEETVELFSASAAEKNLELMCWVPAGATVTAIGDPLRLRQVLTNLLGNAIKFTQDGEVLLRYEIVDDGPKKLSLRFEISDTGVGVEQENQTRIFESFSQEDGSTTRRFGGTGLGLAICRQLIDMMGGEIGVESIAGEGSSFRFTVAFENAGSSCAARRASPRLANVSVLVVDDNETNLQIVNSYLAALGIHSEGATTAYDALKRIDAVAETAPFDVILLDAHVGDMSGLETARAIRANTKLPPEKLVLMSPVAENADFLDARDAGFDDCLAKPVRQSILYESLLMLTAATGSFSARRKPRIVEDDFLTPLQGEVLLVEDNVVNRAVALGMLNELGCDVVVATNGQEAVEFTATRQFDAVLMDCEMPVMDGFEATAAIQARAQGTDQLPIIALTANAIDGDLERCIEAGMQDYISKPVTMESLHASLVKWLQPKTADVVRKAPQTVDRSALNNIRNLKGMGGNKMVKEVIALYLSSSSIQVDDLRESLVEGDAEAVRQSAHALKASSQNVGAAALVDLSMKFEKMGRSGELDQNVEHIDELSALYAQTILALEAEVRRAS